MTTAIDDVLRFSNDILTCPLPNAKQAKDAHFALLGMLRDRRLDRLALGSLKFSLASALISLCLCLRDFPAEQRPALLDKIDGVRVLLAAAE